MGDGRLDAAILGGDVWDVLRSGIEFFAHRIWWFVSVYIYRFEVVGSTANVAGTGVFVMSAAFDKGKPRWITKDHTGAFLFGLWGQGRSRTQRYLRLNI